MLGRISPPFLDFIESSGVTTQWTSLTEVLRGTDSWTPFVAPNATAGATLVTGTVAVLATTLVAAAGLAGLAMRHDACPRPAGDDPADRHHTAGGRIRGWPRIASGTSGSDVPRRRRHPAAQRAQARAADPVAVGARARASARPHPVAGKRAAAAVGARLRPPRERQEGRGRHRGARRVGDGTSLAWTGRLTPPGRVRRDTAVLARDGGLARRAQYGFAARAACWWRPAHRSPRRCGDPATTNRCRCSAAARGVCATRSRSHRRRPSARWIRCSGCSPPGDHRPGWRIPLPDKEFPMSSSETTSTRRRRGRPGRCWCTARSTAPRGCRRSPNSATRSDRARSRASSPTAGCGRSTRPSRSIASMTAAGLVLRMSPTPKRWPASTADPRRCCGSTSAAGCSASRRSGPCC